MYRKYIVSQRKFNEFLYALLFSKQREVGEHHGMYLPWELTLLLEIYSTDKREHKVRYEIADMIFKVTQSRKRKIYDRCVTVHLNQSTLTVRMLLVPVETLLGSTLFSKVVIDSVDERSATLDNRLRMQMAVQRHFVTQNVAVETKI